MPTGTRHSMANVSAALGHAKMPRQREGSTSPRLSRTRSKSCPLRGNTGLSSSRYIHPLDAYSTRRPARFHDSSAQYRETEASWELSGILAPALVTCPPSRIVGSSKARCFIREVAHVAGNRPSLQLQGHCQVAAALSDKAKTGQEKSVFIQMPPYPHSKVEGTRASPPYEDGTLWHGLSTVTPRLECSARRPARMGVAPRPSTGFLSDRPGWAS